ncbi:DUF4292 domain-containing protein [Pedobacter yulinensis]|uniref:DUF4292 domain-containing protein n=1 Tax=Pedobacter yulinensis TaxID=2126353 RepID=A0A2T3HQD3_9SPHI|nr:DUF4292 domain-containing protein [Pedobacter yulinensis]PST84675.1 DUF4292 domain-containing protein [Pedobacter yulinensis]
MKRNILAALSVSLVLIAAGGCKTRKTSAAAPAAKTVPAAAGAIARIRGTQVQFTTLSLRGKALLDMGGNTNNVGIQIRMENGKRIWASITALAGIEVARALITPDSVRVVNRLQSTYLGKPFSFVQGFATRQIDFQMLQSVLSGNVPELLLAGQPGVEKKGVNTVLTGKRESLDYNMFFNELMKLTATNLNDAAAGRALKVEYSAHQEINGGLFPGQVNINSMAGPKRVTMALTFTKIEGNIPLEFPFTVPKRYEVIN